MSEIKNRAKFGIPDIDSALDGGIPRGSLILLEEDTGAKSHILQSKFVAEGLLNDEYCYIFNMEHPPHAIVNSMNAFGLEPEELMSNGQFIIIDGFTDAFGWGEFTSKWKYVCHDLTNLKEVNDVVKAATAAVEPYNNMRGIVDSLTTLFLANDSERAVLNYIHHQMATQKNYGITSMYTIHMGAHRPELVKALEHIVDGVIWVCKVEVDGEPRDMIQIKKLRDSKFSARKYFFNVEDETATLEEIKKR
ncbi:ATPase [Methanocella sp. CWC-04]|uniref:ATPase n=1 Tax=Methanooceanicella nereidis TaxID=2052831 RepID=A0AAP2RBY3_9EURY|nr:ATPase domain-containing protein [Methanocella sp. CWC-04]MCD1294663.1 ATPase [Methanocella sp. CWC-04]